MTISYDFVEIGTAYFDTVIEKNDGRVGLSIDVIQEYLDMLPENSNVTKICCAISNSYDNLTVYKPIFPDNYPKWLSGCVSVAKPHKHVMEYCKNNNLPYENFVTTRIVETIPVNELIKRYNINSVKFLKIDTEGHDTIILNDWLDCCENNKELYPKRIFFESKDLTEPIELTKINERLINLGYKLTFYQYDTEAILF